MLLPLYVVDRDEGDFCMVIHLLILMYNERSILSKTRIIM